LTRRVSAGNARAFRLLADLPLAMTGHVVFTAINPVTPATTSVTIVREVIRGLIGLDPEIDISPMRGDGSRP